jgi:hypothetical protein
MGKKVDGMNAGELPVPLAQWCPDGVDDDGFTHACTSD